ncbi:DUF3558 domain-containing protein [Plantactinospora sp. BB1]|uniref:DUF3558 domain-containing protein n=1 Tax=Plantactinospora sp. BB1 TaxID=2071627 RepID=UPI000D16787D|nr:DUF3558 domain-containing protein [Plantactinospora sp. BB1]AVT35726.1 hypothetical protein C6W10_03775 [Plantactinospora sp. BB1]
MIVRSRPVLVTLTVLALALGTGCGRFGGGDPPVAAPQDVQPAATGADPAAEPTPAEPAAAPVDACALVTKAEAEKLAGTPLEDAVPVRETCSYTGPVTGPTAQVEIYVGDGAKKFLDIERELGHEIWPLPGVGDEAYAEDGAVFVAKGGRWVAVKLVLLNDPKESREPLEEVARTVAGRI